MCDILVRQVQWFPQLFWGTDALGQQLLQYAHFSVHSLTSFKQ
jgi:hypothetical protein